MPCISSIYQKKDKVTLKVPLRVILNPSYKLDNREVNQGFARANREERMKESKNQSKTKYSSEGIGKFLGIAFGCSWLMWGTVILFPALGEQMKQLIILLGVYGPFISMIVCQITGKNEEPMGRIFRRIIQVKAPVFIYGITLLLVPGIFILSWAICGNYLSIEPIIDKSALAILPLILFLFVTNTLPEEASWRGYLMDKFQAKFGPLKTVVIFGFIWGAWHLPLFFIPNFIQNVYVSRIPAFWAVFFLNTLGASFIYLYLYNRSNRSIFIPTLFHTVSNAMTTLLFITLGIEQSEFYSVSQGTVSALTNVQIFFTIGVVLAGVVILGITNGKLGIEYNSFFNQERKEKSQERIA